MVKTYIDCPSNSLVEELNDDASIPDAYWVKLSDDDSRVAGWRYKGHTMVCRDFELEHEYGARGLVRVDISTDEHRRLLKVVG